MGTLVVVDAQPKYQRAARDDSTIAAICREVEEAKAQEWAIIVLEIDPKVFGPTDQRILDLIAGYRRHEVFPKYTTSGRDEVLLVCEVNGYPTDRLRIVGVNTDSCVAVTVKDLSGYFLAVRGKTTIEVVKDACNTEWSLRPWDSFPRAGNIVVV